MTADQIAKLEAALPTLPPEQRAEVERRLAEVRRLAGVAGDFGRLTRAELEVFSALQLRTEGLQPGDDRTMVDARAWAWKEALEALERLALEWRALAGLQAAPPSEVPSSTPTMMQQRWRAGLARLPVGQRAELERLVGLVWSEARAVAMPAPSPVEPAASQPA